MKYISTVLREEKEVVVVSLPLEAVPNFNAENPDHPFTYAVTNEVEVGWIKGENGKFHPPEKVELSTEEQLKILVKPYEQAAQKRLDNFARTRTYDDIKSAAIYAMSEKEPFKTEGKYCLDMQSETWSIAHQILNELMARYTDGLPQLETLLEEFPIETFLSSLPELKWPSDEIDHAN